MSDVTEQALMRAYELIEEEKLTEAEAILEPILEQEPDNVDAWWLYAHAVSDPETARTALNQVLKLDGSYEGAQELLVQLNDHYAGQPTAVTERTPVAPPATLPSLPDDDDVDSPDFLADMEEAKEAVARFDDDFSLDDIEEAGPSAPAARRTFPLVPLIIGLILVLLIVVLLLANPFGSPAVTPTQQAAVASETVIVVTPTPVSETEEVTVVASDSAIVQALSAFEVIEGTVIISDTSLGRTQLAGICTSSDTMRATLSDAMDSLADVSSSVGSEIEAIGVTLVDCENGNNTLRVIAVPVADAVAYSAGDLSADEFQARWVAAA
jgi:tetratricopeptide (TPR) repeat protein